MTSAESNRKNELLKEQFLRVLKELGQELLPEDEAVAKAFFSTDEHLSEQDLLEMVSDSNIELSNVRRTMRLLCNLCVAQKIRLDDTVLFEHMHLNNHHDHLVCVKCGKIVEFMEPEIEKRQLEICSKNSFTPLMHKLEIRGICAECVAKEEPEFPLSSSLSGQQVTVSEVLGGQALRRRLMSLGIVRGTTMQVLGGNGPMTLEVRGTRLALGRGETRNIMVKGQKKK